MRGVLTAGENRRIAQAMLDYQMLAEGSRVLIAVSGGIDSLVLAWVLHFWRRKAPFSYELRAVHVDTRPKEGRAGQVQDRLAAFGIACMALPAEQPAVFDDDTGDPAGVCYRCARNRRRQLFEYARQEGYAAIALGHHQDDLIETFFINITSGGNISTMRPKQELFSGRLALIRPLAYLSKEDIRAIGARLGLEPVPSSCPLAEQTRRKEVRGLLAQIYSQFPGSRGHLFAALGNVRAEYLLLQQEKRGHADKP